MQAEGVRRFLVLSMGALFQDAGILAALLRRTVLRNVAEDAAEMEHVVMASELDWTIVGPRD
jgi:hypothetical protein